MTFCRKGDSRRLTLNRLNKGTVYGGTVGIFSQESVQGNLRAQALRSKNKKGRILDNSHHPILKGINKKRLKAPGYIKIDIKLSLHVKIT